MDGSRKSRRYVCGTLLALLGVGRVGADDVTEAARFRVGAVMARTASFDGASEEETGNCLLWTAGGQTYTLGDLHTVMAGAEGASGRAADQIQVKVGPRSSRAVLVWPPEGRRNVLEVDIAILQLEDGLTGQAFSPDDFQGSADPLPRPLYLAAPGHRSKILAIDAPSVGNRSQWFLYRELSQGDSGGLVFALESGRIIPHGIVSAIGSLPGESARGTVLYGREAIRIVITQFLRATTSARLQASGQ